MKEWLIQDITDNTTRSLTTIEKLHRIQQQNHQIFNQFLDTYKTVESELSYELPEVFRISFIISTLRPELKHQVISIGIPADRQALISAARRAESLIGTTSLPSDANHSHTGQQ